MAGWRWRRLARSARPCVSSPTRQPAGPFHDCLIQTCGVSNTTSSRRWSSLLLQAEEVPQDREPRQAWQSLLRVFVLVFHEAADDQGRSVRDHDVGGQFRGRGAGQTGVGIDDSHASFGVDLHPDHAIIRDKGTQPEQSTGVEELNPLRGADDVLCRDRFEAQAGSQAGFPHAACSGRGFAGWPGSWYCPASRWPARSPSRSRR